jgi:restriction system protein
MDAIWFVRAGRESVYAEEFIQKNVVGIGWNALGEVDPSISKPQLTQLYKQTYADNSDGQAQVSASQIVRFMKEMKIGDSVMTHDRDKQMYYLGIVVSDCAWRPDLIPDLPRIRQVEWQSQIPRVSLSSDTKNTLGAIQTLFLVKDKSAAEVRARALSIETSSDQNALPTQIIASPDQTDLEREIRIELLEKSEQTIEDRIVRLAWEQVQELVAGILRAMGYRTKVSPRGADRGVDIFASPDGLGLEDPRIFVEVKHRPATSMGSQDLRSFIGGRKAGEKCLYVSTGGFTKDARYEAERASIPLTLISLVELRKLFVDYYEKLDEEIKSLIPLKRIYVLAD